MIISFLSRAKTATVRPVHIAIPVFRMKMLLFLSFHNCVGYSYYVSLSHFLIIALLALRKCSDGVFLYQFSLKFAKHHNLQADSAGSMKIHYCDGSYILCTTEGFRISKPDAVDFQSS